MNQRFLTDEILDSMDPSDPRAIRSRHDLRWINFFLGNERRILSELRRHRPAVSSIVELGAGEGILCKRLGKLLPEVTVTALDFAHRPALLPESIGWVRGDFFGTLPGIDADTCIGSLILHHFSDEELDRLGRLLNRFDRLIFCEPLRGALPLVLSRLATPFVGEVTRHDMPASIHAGFRKGEIASLLGLDAARWEIRESESRRGTVMMVASRR
jgi:hypothetical protein